MREAHDTSRTLRAIAGNLIDSVNAERGFKTTKHYLFCALNSACHAAFASWERDAEIIERAVKAMRIVAVEME